MAAAPSDAAVKELMDILQVEKMLENIRAEAEQPLQAIPQQMMAGKKPSANEKKILDDMTNKMVTLSRDSLSWKNMEAVYAQQFKSVYTDEEVNGIIAFYKTPAGQATLNKTPVVLQNSFKEVQKIMVGLNPKMQKIISDSVSQLKAGK